MDFFYVSTPVAFNLVDFTADDGRDYDALFRAFGSLLSGVGSVTLTIDNTDFRDDVYAGHQFLLLGERARDAFEAVGARTIYVPAVVRCKRGGREITGRYAVAPVDVWLPLVDEAKSEFEPFRLPDGYVRTMTVDGEHYTAMRRLTRRVFRTDLDLSSKVFGNLYGHPRGAPYVTADLAQELQRRGCRAVDFLDPSEL